MSNADATMEVTIGDPQEGVLASYSAELIDGRWVSPGIGEAPDGASMVEVFYAHLAWEQEPFQKPAWEYRVAEAETSPRTKALRTAERQPINKSPWFWPVLSLATLIAIVLAGTAFALAGGGS